MIAYKTLFYPHNPRARKGLREATPERPSGTPQAGQDFYKTRTRAQRTQRKCELKREGSPSSQLVEESEIKRSITVNEGRIKAKQQSCTVPQASNLGSCYYL